MNCLYIIATPIGNLEDISLRALRILQEVDLILCEDTRKTHKLLSYYKIKKPLLSYHQHSSLKKTEVILQYLREGRNIALVSDSGTPGISDPGNKLIALIRNKLPQVVIVPIPGPSAITAIASVAGRAMDKFLFLGFPPKKRKRQQFFQQILSSSYPVIFYESPYRIQKTLSELQELSLKEKIKLYALVGREMTKKFESFYSGSLEETISQLKNSSPKGEFTILVSKKLIYKSGLARVMTATEE